jgi:hypothetical protein
MTRRTVVLVFCDLAHDGEVEGETVSLVVGQETTEVDLCGPHRAELIEPLLSVGRQVRKPGRKPGQRASGSVSR